MVKEYKQTNNKAIFIIPSHIDNLIKIFSKIEMLDFVFGVKVLDLKHNDEEMDSYFSDIKK